MQHDLLQRSDADPSPGMVLPPHPVLADFYSDAAERQAVVNRLFDDAAPYYDRVTDLLSAWSGRWYRRTVLRRIGVRRGARVLDVACGTGQVSREAVRLVGSGGVVVGVDPSEGMRRVARGRGVSVLEGTAERLPVPSEAFDVVVMGYALRHVSDLIAAFREMRRVLRPGGSLAILEIGLPTSAVGRALQRLYFKRLIPGLCRVTASRRTSTLMRYYWESIERCAAPAEILRAMTLAGLESPGCRRTLGMFIEYEAVAPGAPGPRGAPRG